MKENKQSRIGGLISFVLAMALVISLIPVIPHSGGNELQAGTPDSLEVTNANNSSGEAPATPHEGSGSVPVGEGQSAGVRCREGFSGFFTCLPEHIETEISAGNPAAGRGFLYSHNHISRTAGQIKDCIPVSRSQGSDAAFPPGHIPAETDNTIQ